jgi:DNA (cytosine-5)-methyltransferase 1
LEEGDINLIKNPKKDLGYVDVVTSGFPCQAFSVAGYRKGFKDPRGNLFFETARFIDDIKPKAFLLENVKNMVTHDNRNTMRFIENTITKELNYSFIPFILNAKDYGNIPQTRERIYIVGFKGEGDQVRTLNDDNELNMYVDPESKTGRFKIPSPLKMKKSIHDVLVSGKVDDKFYYDKTKYHDQLKREMKNPDTIYQWRRVYCRENKSNVCPTLTANMGTGGHNVPLILTKSGIRKLIPKECVGFQGFPKGFKFPKDMNNSHCYKQAGNSVVVPVVKRIATKIKYCL